MKKLMIMLMALLAISLSACSQNGKKENKQMKTLVAYFSASGVTKKLHNNWLRLLVQTFTRLSQRLLTRMQTLIGTTNNLVLLLK